MKQVLPTLAATLLVLGCIEVALRITWSIRNHLVESVPLPYVIGGEQGPVPPWVNGLRVLQDDPALMWRGRSHVRQSYVDVFAPSPSPRHRTALVRQFLPVLPPSLRGNPRWEVALNSEGFREAELPAAKPRGTFRVVCLGDSWTFGANVSPEGTYPRQLERLLRSRFSGVRFEVLNLGMLGYSSHQGLELLRMRGLALRPDLVVIAFAMNDASIGGYHDRDVAGVERVQSLRKRLRSMLRRSEIYGSLHYLAKLYHWTPTTPARELQEAAREADGEDDAGDMEPWTRVPLKEYSENFREMIRLVRNAGGETVLLYNEFDTNGRYLALLQEVSAATSAPLVDGSALLADERERLEADRTRALGLRPAGITPGPGGPLARVVFRVHAADHPVPERLFVSGSATALGASVPNQVALHDDASHGDERAGDGVWSLAVDLAPGRIAYVYTNSGAPGAWQGLDVPSIRSFGVDPAQAGHTLHRPVEVFGAMDLHADPWHTNAAGYAAIAEAVADTIQGDPAIVAALARVQVAATAGSATGP